MSLNFPKRPRILSHTAHKYIGKNVAVTGQVISITAHANTLTLRMPDDENLIVLLPQGNSTRIEPNLLTEIGGRLVSKGQVEASYIRQYDVKGTASFSAEHYKEWLNFTEAFPNHYDP